MPGPGEVPIISAPAPEIVQKWQSQVGIYGFGGACDGAMELPTELASYCQRGPFDSDDLPQITARILGVRTLLVGLQQTLDHPAMGRLPDPERRAVIVGSQTAAISETVDFLTQVDRVGANLVNPGLFPFTVMNAASGMAAIQFNCRGANITLNNGAVSAIDAIAYGADLIANKQADLVLAGGFEGLDERTAGLMGRAPEPLYFAFFVALMRPDSAAECGARQICEVASYAKAESLDGETLLAHALEAGRGSSTEELTIQTVADGQHHESTLLEILRVLHLSSENGAGHLASMIAGSKRDEISAALVLRGRPPGGS